MTDKIDEGVPARVLRLTLEHNERGEISAQWHNNPGTEEDPNAEKSLDSDGYLWPAYLLNEAEVQSAAAEIDLRLKALIALDWPDSFDLAAGAGKRPGYAAEVRALADAGMALREALLTGKRNDAKSVKVARKFSEWFDERLAFNERDAWRIEVVYLRFPSTYPRTVPWGLCYDPHTEEELSGDGPDPSSPEGFSGFWCQRYGLAVRGKDAHVHNLEAKRGGLVRMLVVLERPQGGKSQIEESAPRAAMRGLEQSVWEDHFADDAQSYKQKVNEVVGQKEDDSYLYLSLRANSQDGTPHMITVPDIKKLRGHLEEDVLMLVVLDGDAVVRGDRGINWLTNLMDLGQNGLIATEADIENSKLRFLGWEALVHILKSGKPIISAVREFRRMCWPVGLIYGVYCNPLHAYVDPPPNETINEIGKLLKERRHAN